MCGRDFVRAFVIKYFMAPRKIMLEHNRSLIVLSDFVRLGIKFFLRNTQVMHCLT